MSETKRGLMCVETAPASPEVVDAYHEWYRIHLREILAIDGVVAVRRYAPAGDDGRYVAMYELEGSDLMEVAARIRAAAPTRTPQPEGVLQTDPPATVRFLDLLDSLP